MNTKIKKLIYAVTDSLNLKLGKRFPRESTKAAKSIFKNKLIKVIEIGTYKGENARDILKRLNVEKFYAIDAYEDTEEYDNVSELFDYGSKLEKDNINVELIMKYSDEALEDINEQVDFIYIDGSHEYPQVKKDMENYWDKLKVGGIIGGHDIMGHQGVSKSVIEFCYENKLNPFFLGEDWIIIKEKE